PLRGNCRSRSPRPTSPSCHTRRTSRRASERHGAHAPDFLVRRSRRPILELALTDPAVLTKSDLLHDDLHVRIFILEVAPHANPVVGLVAPVRRASDVIHRRDRIVAVPLALQLLRVRHYPDVDAVLPSELADALERLRDVLRLRHIPRTSALELVPRINHEPLYS